MPPSSCSSLACTVVMPGAPTASDTTQPPAARLPAACSPIGTAVDTTLLPPVPPDLECTKLVGPPITSSFFFPPLLFDLTLRLCRCSLPFAFDGLLDGFALMAGSLLLLLVACMVTGPVQCDASCIKPYRLAFNRPNAQWLLVAKDMIRVAKVCFFLFLFFFSKRTTDGLLPVVVSAVGLLACFCCFELLLFGLKVMTS